MKASKSHPYQSAAQGPDNEEQLEAEVEQHAWSGDVLIQQAGVPSAIYAPIAAVDDFGAGTPRLCNCDRLVIDGGAAAQVNDPENDHSENCRKNERDRDD
jgi:hypothetical protein